ncbi:MAG: hypothetical protein IKA87_06590 [Lentisphaeria bacterium]|nr:hypothetical protein [Lentisphaeria bacterium]
MNILNLDGAWDFTFDAQAAAIPETLPELTWESSLSVPGCFDVAAPYFGKRGVGYYRTFVRTGGLIRLSIDGVGVEGKVFWDGRFIGACPYAYMPEKFTFDAGEKGEHELVIVICNHFNKIYFPYYDFYAYGGIFGSVKVEELPGYCIDLLKVTTLDYKTGRVSADVTVNKFFRKARPIVFEIDGKEVLKGEFAGKNNVYEFNVPDFKLWSPEAPNLHRLRVVLGDFEHSCNIGLRTIETKGVKLLLNGRELRLMGYNRHDSHPEFGAAIPGSLQAADLQMLKDQGSNFIRGSHYPQRESFLDLCDKLGILIWEETLGWDVRDAELFKPEFLFKQKDQARKLSQTHYNHPCIIIWGFMNETLSEDKRCRKIIQKVYDTYKANDATRLVTYASNRYEKDICMDIVDIVAMNPYPGWGDISFEEVHSIHRIRPRFEALEKAVPADKPYMISETGASAIYGHRDPHRLRWSEEYQAELVTEVCNVILRDPRYCGLAFWHFCDAKSYLNGGRVKGLNDKGILNEYRQPKMAWHAITESIKEIGLIPAAKGKKK